MLNCIRPVSPTARNVVIVATILVVISAVAVAAIYKQPIGYKKFNWPSRRICIVGGAGALVMTIAGIMLVHRANANKLHCQTFKSREQLETAFNQIPKSGRKKVKLEYKDGQFCDENQTRLDAPRQACYFNGRRIEDPERFIELLTLDPRLNQYTNQSLAAILLGVAQPIFTMEIEDKDDTRMVYFINGHGHFVVNAVCQNGASFVEAVFITTISKVDEDLKIDVVSVIEIRTLIEPGAAEAEVTWKKIEEKPRIVNLLQTIGSTRKYLSYEVTDEML